MSNISEMFWVVGAALGFIALFAWRSGFGRTLLLAMNALATEYNNQYSMDDEDEKDE